MGKRSQTLILAIVGLLLAIWLICWIVAEALWFDEIGYFSVFWLRLETKTVIWAIGSVMSTFFLLGNLALAERLRYKGQGSGVRGQGSEFIQHSTFNIQHSTFSNSRFPTPDSPAIPFQWLLPLTIGLSLFLSLLVLHYAKAAWTLREAHFIQPSTLFPLPDRFDIEAILQIGRQLLLENALFSIPFLGVGMVLLGTIALLIYPRQILTVIAVVFSIGLGFILAAHWDKVLLYAHPTPFDRVDPLFNRDISFYVFSLPLWELLEFWLLGLMLYGLVAVALIYLLSGESLSLGIFPGFLRRQRQHLCGLGGGVMLVVALGYWLGRYELLYSSRGVVQGASYTDVTIQLPANTVLSVLSVAIAAFFLGQAFLGIPKKKAITARRSAKTVSPTLMLFLAYTLIVVTIGVVLPEVIQHLVVLPNELAREQPYIQRSIALTRDAFDLNSIDVETFDPQNTLTYTDLQANKLTIRNIRLWDTRPLLETNRQLQQIRPYYHFVDADVDRYTIRSSTSGGKQQSDAIANRDGDEQQVLIAARELDYSAVPDVAKTWVNEHLVYTHGYGFTVTPVNRVAPGGLPDYFVKDIGTGSGITESGELITSSEQIRASFPIHHPRIYFGELTNTYIMTGTRAQELDYPNGDDNVYNTYDGLGGISLDSLWRRWLFAIYLRDWQMVFTNNFKPETKLLFRRDINQRIRAIAPFLTFDQDPYLVVVDVEGTGNQGAENSEFGIQNLESKTQNSKLKTQNSKLSSSPLPPPSSLHQNSLFWVVDAYTTSDRYPYSNPSQIQANAKQNSFHSSFNYVRNSVKVVVDAYNGSVDFYVADPNDPVIQAWAAIFPDLFKPLNEMPVALRNHIRYPQDFFRAQSEQLMTFHMTDPQVFYNREDQWQVPSEIYGNEPQLVEPYYLIMKLPTAKSEEFILLLPYTPKQRTNLIAWLASRSDGQNYGKSLLYLFPKQKLVYGTEQIEARINQDPIISQQISLWNRQGSRVIQGNLLVIPIGQSLLYVEPLYLEATQNSLPTLVRIVVVYENQIVMAETLEKALQSVFESQKSTAPPIVRPVQ